MNARTSRVAAWAGVGIIAGCAVLFLAAEGRAVRAVAFLVPNLLVLAALGLRAREPGRASPLPWRLLLAVFTLYTVSNLGWYLIPLYGSPLPLPSPVDAGLLLSYVGFGVVLRRAASGYARSGLDRRGRVEVAILTLGLSAPLWELTQPDRFAGPLLPTLTLLAYPAMLLVLLAGALRLLLLADRIEPCLVLLLGWIAGELGGDLYYAVAQSGGTFSLASPYIVCFLVSWSCLLLAALHPGWTFTERQSAPRERSSQVRLIWLTAAVCLPVATMVGVTRQGEVPYYAAVVLLAVLGLLLYRVSGLIVDLDEQQRWLTEVEELGGDLAHQALHDPLTGLPNRSLLHDRMDAALRQRSSSSERGVIALWLDLDRFKEVNDAWGHSCGDQLLCEVARRLASEVREGDTVARVGGDEFVVLLPDATLDDALEVADRITAALAERLELGPASIAPQASVGIALALEGHDRETLLKHADAAMYEAKEESSGGYRVFNSERHGQALARHALSAELKTVVGRGELFLVYQPVVELASDTIVGVEALVRWNHPTRGLLSPLEWIPLAEANTSICEIGAWVLEEACAQLERWDAEHPGHPPLHMAVNLSPRQMDDPRVVARLGEILWASAVDPSRIVLEVTETALSADLDLTIARLKELKALGVQVAIDDFGTGFSSLSFLRKLPIDLLKVDKAFVDGVALDPDEWAFTAAIVTLAHSLGKQVVAEGIETGEQLAHLIALRCTYGQGYLFSPPVHPAQISALLSPPTLARVSS